MSNQLSAEEYLALSVALEKHHSVFQKLWYLGRPIFSHTTPRASVLFNAAGENLDFIINHKFWISKTLNQKAFTVAHECLHVILNHGLRIKNCANKRLAGLAMDVVANHLLIDRFGFSRLEIDPENELCWIDTVFPDQPNLPIDKSFEYYYNLLENSKIIPTTEHQHEEIQDFSDLISKLDKELPLENKSGLETLINYHGGSESAKLWTIVNLPKIKTKRKWETVITRWAKKQLKEAQEEQWALPSRRLTLISDELLVPSEFEIETFEKDKVEVWAFQDTSGSCAHFKTRFFKAFKSLPQDRFDLKMHCFDTRVYEASLSEGKLYGFGGTSFRCIDEYIKSNLKLNQRHPFIWILTDGYGDTVSPSRPEKWYWFLSHDYKNYIPNKSNIFMLKDFE